ncbi:hypothetical protein I302_107846 [Kwoniella bestiolae CBS 10118]|uniref:Transcription factor CBF/NF-Y/archaeal histone domain-containing protein n=1 Tax=Kwoniella bestiolae CBS 10118 TaxID=1296100 RepID=A0A1B9FXD9_9TREE|nr:hypothetical protein I302_06414 [Kwoniella bestiolae CBS 10118]OCF23432.1 hypothetical protein I302_06414 [Kwoniella bestiolae CBS 10118]
MQLDEEVGKLASATPVMISKSLECFMQQLIDETCKETRSRGSKKMTAYHLKHMINSNPTFDFLRDLVETIPDPVIAEPKAGPSKQRKVSASNPNDPAGGASGVKKRSKKDQQQHQHGYGQQEALSAPAPNPNSLPNIGTWKRDFEGGGGSGEGGRGIFDDYEEDEDDY